MAAESDRSAEAEAEAGWPAFHRASESWRRSNRSGPRWAQWSSRRCARAEGGACLPVRTDPARRESWSLALRPMASTLRNTSRETRRARKYAAARRHGSSLRSVAHADLSFSFKGARRRRHQPLPDSRRALFRRKPQARILVHETQRSLGRTVPHRRAHRHDLSQAARTTPARCDLDRGTRRAGFGRLRCSSCNESRIVAWSCKGRGFCPSCLGRRMCATAQNLVERVLPEQVALRQWVLTFPFPWRGRLARDGALLGALTRIFVESVERLYTSRATDRRAGIAKTGAVTVVQRTSSDIRPDHPRSGSNPCSAPPRGRRRRGPERRARPRSPAARARGARRRRGGSSRSPAGAGRRRGRSSCRERSR